MTMLSRLQTLTARCGGLRLRMLILGLVLGLAPLLGLLPLGAVQAASGACVLNGDNTVTCTYTFTGAEQSFLVPAGVTSIQVTANGAPGGAAESRGGGGGGAGAQVAGTLPVSPGEPLYLEVGGPATSGSGCFPIIPVYCNGGFNGGGTAGAFAGGGGGASDVRTTSMSQRDSLTSRLLVASGGGGGGDFSEACSAGSGHTVPGGAGGAGGFAGGAGADCGSRRGGAGGLAGAAGLGTGAPGSIVYGAGGGGLNGGGSGGVSPTAAAVRITTARDTVVVGAVPTSFRAAVARASIPPARRRSSSASRMLPGRSRSRR